MGKDGAVKIDASRLPPMAGVSAESTLFDNSLGNRLLSEARAGALRTQQYTEGKQGKRGYDYSITSVSSVW